MEIPRNSLGESCRGMEASPGGGCPQTQQVQLASGCQSIPPLLFPLGQEGPGLVPGSLSPAPWISVTCSEPFSPLKAPCGKMKRKSLTPPHLPLRCFTQPRTYFLALFPGLLYAH